MPPDLSSSIFAASQSTHTTWWPTSAKHVPVTNPAYPVPMMQISINATFDSQWPSNNSTNYLFPVQSKTIRIDHYGGVVFAGTGFVGANSKGATLEAGALESAAGKSGAGALVLASSG